MKSPALGSARALKFAGLALAGLVAACALCARAGEGETFALDFRYAPVNCQTAICLPDDWQKTLVARDGSMLYDYPGKGLDCDTVISLGIDAVAQWRTQQLVSARVPIVRTEWRAGDLEIVQEAFAVAPALKGRGSKNNFRIERLGSNDKVRGWAKPPVGTDRNFANIALGSKKPIVYRFKADPGENYVVAFGLCEGWHDKTGQRVLNLLVESNSVRTVDMIAEKGRNRPAVFLFPARDENEDGWIYLEATAAENSPDKNAILNTLWIFKQQDAPPADALVAGNPNSRALAQVDCSQPPTSSNPARHDLVTMSVRNHGASPAPFAARLQLRSTFPVLAQTGASEARIGAGTKLLLPARAASVETNDAGTVISFAPQTLAPGESRSLAVAVLRGKAVDDNPIDLSKAGDYRRKAEQFWTKLDLPYNKLSIPDPGVQALLDSSIRNIYQAREIKNGLPAFQVGPTRYRGLWVVDGSFLMESVTYLGREKEARSGIQYLLGFQQPDGSFMLIDGHYKETGIALWAVSRHAKLTGDKAWLRSVWPKVERGMAYIEHMRTLPPADAPNARLTPDGFSDGGLGGRFPEYTNIYWTLAGMRAAIEAARWLGDDANANAWQKEYDDFYSTFRRAAQRDMKKDAHGNGYLPIRMIANSDISPQKAQWAFLHAVYPGKIFDREDPLVTGNMAMLKAAECEGLVLDTGWIKDGLWNYFGSFYAHAWLWLGDGAKASRTLYDFGNHASPLLVWREEQMPQGKGDQVVGDMPHNWASAEFIRLVRHSLAFERGSELHLLEAFPRAWAKPGQVTRAEGIPTEFGSLSLRCEISRDGNTATVKVVPPRRAAPSRIVLHTENWSGHKAVIELPPDKTTTRRITIVL